MTPGKVAGKIKVQKDKTELTPEFRRLSELITKLKEKYGTTRLSGLMGTSFAGVAKWENGELKDIENLQVGNVQRVAQLLNWSTDELMHYLRGTTPVAPSRGEGIDISSLSSKEKLLLVLELVKNIVETQEDMDKSNENQEVVSLSKKERWKLARLADRSLGKARKTTDTLIEESKLPLERATAILNAEEDFEIKMSDLDILAPHCFRPLGWDKADRPGDLSESRFRSGKELLAAIRNGNGAVK